MTKREFVEAASHGFRAALFGHGGDDQSKSETAVKIALDLWAEIEKQCPREFSLEVPT